MRINGEEERLTETVTLLRLLEAHGYDPKAVAVECNGEIVPRTRFASTLLGDGDIVEILRFVGGG